MATSKITWIGLGSNLSGPEKQIFRAIDELAKLPKSKLITCSSLYLTKPVGPKDQPDFVNCVCQVNTTLGPKPFLAALQHIENCLGRNRALETIPWGPRIIDCDLLFHGHTSLKTPELQLPHPRITQRAFVLAPLSEVAPDWLLPNGKSVLTALQDLGAEQLSTIRVLREKPPLQMTWMQEEMA